MNFEGVFGLPLFLGFINMNMSKIILIEDLLDAKLRKEKELKYYQEELEKLQVKMFFIKKEIDLTNTIIDIIEKEKVIDLKKGIEEKTNASEPE